MSEVYSVLNARTESPKLSIADNKSRGNRRIFGIFGIFIAISLARVSRPRAKRRSNPVAGALMRFAIRGCDYNVACAIRRVLAARQWCMRQA